jgi:probable O-glycosylation ligase (exosortase A-associated)
MKGLILTYLLTYGGALASLFNPFVGLLVYVAFAILRPDYLWSYSLPQGNYSRIVAIGLLAGWILKGCGDWNFRRAGGIVWALLGYLGFAAFSATQARYPAVAWAFVESQAKIVLPFLVGITTIRTEAQLKRLSWVIVLCQAYLALEFNLSYFAGYNRVQYEGFGGMDNNCCAIALVTCTGFAFFLALGESSWRKILALACAGLMVHATLLTFSRGGMLSLVITGCMAFFLMPKRPRDYVLFAIAVALAIRFAGPEVRQRFGTAFAGEEKRDYSAQSRLELWSACWDLMKKHPILGVGPDHFPVYVERYGFPRGKEAHSLWFQLGAELGFPGLILLLGFYFTAMRRLWPLARDRVPGADPWTTCIARMVVAALAGFLVSAQFVSLEGLEVPYYITLAGAAALKGLDSVGSDLGPYEPAMKPPA